MNNKHADAIALLAIHAEQVESRGAHEFAHNLRKSISALENAQEKDEEAPLKRRTDLVVGKCYRDPADGEIVRYLERLDDPVGEALHRCVVLASTAGYIQTGEIVTRLITQEWEPVPDPTPAIAGEPEEVLVLEDVRAHLRNLQHAVLLLAERATGNYDVRMDEVRRLVAHEVGVPHEAAQKKWVPRIG